MDTGLQATARHRGTKLYRRSTGLLGNMMNKRRCIMKSLSVLRGTTLHNPITRTLTAGNRSTGQLTHGVRQEEIAYHGNRNVSNVG
jgi:hypothetical protein